MSENILNCHHHDYLEAACTFFYQLAVTTDSETLTGIAKDLSTRNKLEWLHLETEQGLVKINLTDIVKIQVLTPNPQFEEVIFKAN
jgi:transcriptional antiterminator Rof (Rho-off)